LLVAERNTDHEIRYKFMRDWTAVDYLGSGYGVTGDGMMGNVRC
jgi:hypothetical protein